MAATAEDEQTEQKPLFLDMVHSNNAARIRLYIAHKEGLSDLIDSRMITYPYLQTAEYKAINPLRKVPAFVGANGEFALFESYVILQYLVDKYGHIGERFVPETPEDRAKMQLIIRCHDIYIASPNCTQPGFAHTQGCMYLGPRESEFCPSFRVMERKRRAAKLQELFSQLVWLNDNMSQQGPYMMGDHLSLADFTWFPTVIFMEYMLPRVYGWPDIFNEDEYFSNIKRWFQACKETSDTFVQVREDIWNFWVVKDEAGQFVDIKDELADSKANDNGKYLWAFDELKAKQAAKIAAQNASQ